MGWNLIEGKASHPIGERVGKNSTPFAARLHQVTGPENFGMPVQGVEITPDDGSQLPKLCCISGTFVLYVERVDQRTRLGALK